MFNVSFAFGWNIEEKFDVQECTEWKTLKYQRGFPTPMSPHLLVQDCTSHLIPVDMYLCKAVIASLIQSIFPHSVYCNIIALFVSKTSKRSVTSMFSTKTL